ncbi:hypothetical protein [Miltoncostaea marina]|uniref:hypothetical protein n=1 Tax=Miltoncostaea marina TaxID=2843215 RepID=UPI001C3D2DAE|nr:hypothetical protein [Miltoncostaea marina]
MKRSRALATVLATVACLGVATAAAAAPAGAPGTRAATVQLAKLKKADAQFRATLKRAAPCRTAPQVRHAVKIRNAAMRKAARSSARQLRAKSVRMWAARVRLAKAAGRCTATTTPATGAPVVIQPGASGVVVVPGAPGAPGGAGAPGVASLSVDLPVKPILDALPIDLSAALGAGVLPQTISLVPSTSLTDPVCALAGTACVGISTAQLKSVLTSLTSGVPLVGPLLTPVLDRLTGGNLASLLRVERLGDRTLRIVPVGPLATLRALLGSLAGAPTKVVGSLRVNPAA